MANIEQLFENGELTNITDMANKVRFNDVSFGIPVYVTNNLYKNVLNVNNDRQGRINTLIEHVLRATTQAVAPVVKLSIPFTFRSKNDMNASFIPIIAILYQNNSGISVVIGMTNFDEEAENPGQDGEHS